jgi:hypothetical protein
MIMRRVLLFAFVSLLCVGCVSVDKKREKDARKVCVEFLESTLNDPKSLIIHNEKVVQNNYAVVEFVVDYGAKNRLGGMVRKTSTFEVMPNNPELLRIDGMNTAAYLMNLIGIE